jgi:hypothetical protein
MDFVHGGRDRPENEQPVRSEGERSAGVGGDMPESLEWYDDNADNRAAAGLKPMHSTPRSSRQPAF